MIAAQYLVQRLVIAKLLTGCLIGGLALTFNGYPDEAVRVALASEASDASKTALFWLGKKSLENDLWAKYFLARAHLHVLQGARESHLTEEFINLGLPEDVRVYWEAYRELLRDPQFIGSERAFLELSHEGIRARFKPLINPASEREKHRVVKEESEFNFEGGSTGSIIQFPASEMTVIPSGDWISITGLAGTYSM